MVMLTVLRDAPNVWQKDSLHTDDTQSSQMEQLTVTLHWSALRLEDGADVRMTGLGTTSDIKGKLLVPYSGN